MFKGPGLFANYKYPNRKISDHANRQVGKRYTRNSSVFEAEMKLYNGHKSGNSSALGYTEVLPFQGPSFNPEDPRFPENQPSQDWSFEKDASGNWQYNLGSLSK